MLSKRIPTNKRTNKRTAALAARAARVLAARAARVLDNRAKREEPSRGTSSRNN